MSIKSFKSNGSVVPATTSGAVSVSSRGSGPDATITLSSKSIDRLKKSAERLAAEKPKPTSNAQIQKLFKSL